MPRLVVLSFVIISLTSILLGIPTWTHALPSAYATSTTPTLRVTSSGYGSNLTSLTSLEPGSTFVVNVNITGAGLVSAFDITLNYAILSTFSPPISADSISLSPGLFDGSGLPNGCTVVTAKKEILADPFNTLRVVAYLSGDCGLGIDGNGTLFSVTFSVIRIGSTSIDVVQASGGNLRELVVGGPGTSFAPVPNLQVISAYFRNQPGMPPIALFTYSPGSPVVGNFVTFNASQSFDPDNASGRSEGISNYIWSWGDLSLNGIGNGVVQQHQFTAVSSQAPSQGYFEVRLVVNDTDEGIFAGSSKVVFVSSFYYDVGVKISVDRISVMTGDPVQVTVTVFSNGNQDENVNLTVTYDYSGVTVLGSLPSISLPQSNRTYTFRVTLQTFNLTPRVYTIRAEAEPNNKSVVDPTPEDNVAHASFHLLLPSATLASMLTVDTAAISFPGDTQVIFIGINLSAVPVGVSAVIPPDVSLLKPDGAHVNLTATLFDIGPGRLLMRALYNIPPTGSLGDYVVQITLSLPTGQIAYSIKAFEVKPSWLLPGRLEIKVDSGSVYFPGDTAVFYITTQYNGTQVLPGNIRVILVKPDGTNTTLRTNLVSLGVFKASYQIPITGSIGTYSLIVSGDKPGLVSGTSSTSFEAKPAWLSTQANRIVSLASLVGVVATVGIAWKMGYLNRKRDED